MLILALDSNVLIDLWNNTPQGQSNARRLALVLQRGDALIICGAVYSELHAHPGMTNGLLDTELAQLGIAPDFVMGKAICQEAGRAHAEAATRRRVSGQSLPRRPLADHLIGAHAVHRGSPQDLCALLR